MRWRAMAGRAVWAGGAVLSMTGCGSTASSAHPAASSTTSPGAPSATAPTGSPTAPAVRTSAPEPAVSPPTAVAPAGVLISVGHEPEGIVADGPTGELAVSVRGAPSGDGVELLSLSSRRVIGFTPTVGAARHLQLAAPGGPVLVPAEGSDTVYTLSLGAAGVLSTAKVGRQPHDAAPLAGAVLVTDELADEVTVLTGTTAAATVHVPVQPGGVAGGTMVDGRSPVALVVGVRGRQVEALGPTGADLGRAAAGVGPTHVRFGGGYFYVADTSGGRILVYTVDARGPHQVASVAAPGAPYGLAVDAARGRVWVTLTATNQVEEYQVSGSGLSALRSFPTPRQPNDVTVDPATGDVAVAGTGADEVQLLQP